MWDTIKICQLSQIMEIAHGFKNTAKQCFFLFFITYSGTATQESLY